MRKGTGSECTYVRMIDRGGFKRLYNDGQALLKSAQEDSEAGYFQKCCLSRISILLFALSLEALANQLIHDIFERTGEEVIEERSPTKEKWKIIPLRHPESVGRKFNTSSSIWRQFVELLKWRDEQVHPKAAIPIVAKMGKKVGKHREFEYVKRSQVPERLRGLLFPNRPKADFGLTGLPLSPHEVVPDHAETAKRIVDGVVARLDELLGGHLTRSGFLKERETAIAIHPDGTIQNLELLTGLDLEEELR